MVFRASLIKNGTCSKALLPTQRQPASIHQIPKEPPAYRGLIQIYFSGLGYSVEKDQNRGFITRVF